MAPPGFSGTSTNIAFASPPPRISKSTLVFALLPKVAIPEFEALSRHWNWLQIFYGWAFQFNTWWFFKLKLLALLTEVRYLICYQNFLDVSFFQNFWKRYGHIKKILQKWSSLRFILRLPACCLYNMETLLWKALRTLNVMINGYSKKNPLGSLTYKIYIGFNRV